ncbi:MAG: hypothetical protein JXR70_10625 [Spirochaetales bacterium]|nr:hypothetical protein [Spirochaetales bacterium]
MKIKLTVLLILVFLVMFTACPPPAGDPTPTALTADQVRHAFIQIGRCDDVVQAINGGGTVANVSLATSGNTTTATFTNFEYLTDASTATISGTYSVTDDGTTATYNMSATLANDPNSITTLALAFSGPSNDYPSSGTVTINDEVHTLTEYFTFYNSYQVETVGFLYMFMALQIAEGGVNGAAVFDNSGDPWTYTFTSFNFDTDLGIGYNLIISGTFTQSAAQDAYGGSVTVGTDDAGMFTAWALNMTATAGEPTGGTFTINGTAYPTLEGVAFIEFQQFIGEL